MSYIFRLSICLCVSCSYSPPKKIDEENEANLLAVLTETLDSIPVDEDGLPSFEALADGDVTNASDRSCPSSPDGSPRTPEPEEPSLVRPQALLSHHYIHDPNTCFIDTTANPGHVVALLPVYGRHQIRLFDKFWHQKRLFFCLICGHNQFCHIPHNVC